MILIDTNALVVLLLGIIDPRLISKNKRTSIYEPEDFYDLLSVIGKLEKIVVLPNIWTEVDNLLNNITGSYKDQYVKVITETINTSSEKYLKSVSGTTNPSFFDLGLTDSLILEYSKECDFLVTSDSRLSDYAQAYGIKVYDMIKARNEKIKNKNAL
jgi:rRNA-processing protein FCF1